MHKSSIEHMVDCFDRFLLPMGPGSVLDVGSGMGPGVASPYKAIFDKATWKYVGLDLAAGSNVDIVVEDPFIWPIADESFDAIISGQMMEHNSMFWLTFLEMARVLKTGGRMIHIAPSRGFEHRAPTDCWRFYRDGMSALAEWSGLRCLEATTDWRNEDLAWLEKKKPHVFAAIPNRGLNGNGGWGDTAGVFEKPENWKPSIAAKYLDAFVDRLPR